MDVQLHRLDLLQCGALQPGTLEVLPVGKKKQQKVAVGEPQTRFDALRAQAMIRECCKSSTSRRER